MLTIVIDVIVLAFVFVVGAAVGSHNPQPVANAIQTLQAAEAKAKATIDQIAAHKAS